MTKDKALKLALEALEKTQNEGYNLPGSAIREAIAAIEEALAQTQEPLTDAQINDLRLALNHDIEDLPDPWDFKEGFRAAERAYGIEKNT